MNPHHIAGGIQQLELTVLNEVGRRHVSVDGIPVYLADNYLLMSGWHGELVVGTETLRKPAPGQLSLTRFSHFYGEIEVSTCSQ